MKFNQLLGVSIALLVSLLYFFVKGVVYFTLGSFIPLAVITLVLVLLLLSAKRSKLAFKRTLAFWSVLVIIWSSLRLLLFAVDIFLKPIPEAHVHYNLQGGLIWSVLFFFCGVYLFLNKSRLSENVLSLFKSG